MLPTIDKPVYEETIPSTGDSILIRPFTVGEEKILLSAKETNSSRQVMLALSQVIGRCVQNKNFEPKKLTVFDVEYLFLKLRAMSVSDVIDMVLVEGPEEKVNIKINIDDIKFQGGEYDSKIDLGSGVTLNLKYPTIALTEQQPADLDSDQAVNYLIYGCIENIVTEDEVINISDLSMEEVFLWIDENITPKAHQEIRTYIESIPRMFYEVNYTTQAGESKSLVLKSLNDFFM